MGRVIRRGVTRDIRVIVPLVREFCESEHQPFDIAVAVRGVAALLEHDLYGVIWVDDDPVWGVNAYAVVTWGWSVEAGGREAVLDEIFVRDRNRGTGTALIEHLIADCRSRGVKRIFLETETANALARYLYKRHGFVTEDSIWMARWLEPRDGV